MHHITGAPQVTAQGHELMATTFARQAEETAALADADPDVRLAEVWRRAAAHDAGVSAGHTFRAAELRYDARGGLTEEQARRRFEPGARWSVRGWWTGAILGRDDDEVLFTEGYAEHVQYMTRENGWRLVAPAPTAPGDVSP